MLKKIICVFIFINSLVVSQEKIKEYSFIIMDSPQQLFTMRQVNQNYISLYRIIASTLNKSIESKRASLIVQAGMLVFFMPMTHEEGHRSILTNKSIGAISQPYFNLKGAAYVKGVEDRVLKNLRDTNLPEYIRLHTAGLESDYMLAQKVESLCAFEDEDFINLKLEYYLRKFSIVYYYCSGLFGAEIGIEEEDNELERDIVGHDVYGAVRHIFRPEMDFYRYTQYKDLTDEEKVFVDRVGYRSFVNLLNPLIIGKQNFQLSETIKANFGFGYSMAPFGDFIDENIWFQYLNEYNFHFYLRQFQNKDNWFYGCGLAISNFALSSKISTSIETHFWTQPEDLDFRTSESFVGGAVDLTCSYRLFKKDDKWLKTLGVDLGIIYKSKGFLPEEVVMDEHFGFRIGTTIGL